MLNKAVLEVLQRLTYLSHNFLLILPIACTRLKFSFVKPSSRIQIILMDLIWPLVSIFTLALTVYELLYFIRRNDQTNFINIFYHGLFLFIRVPLVIMYFVFKTSPNQFCHLFNSIVNLSKTKHFSITQKSVVQQKPEDDLFVFMLFCIVAFLLGFHFVVTPITSVLLPCSHGIPIFIWFWGSCSSGLFRIFVWFLTLFVSLPIGSIASLVGIGSCITIKCIDTTLRKIM